MSVSIVDIVHRILEQNPEQAIVKASKEESVPFIYLFEYSRRNATLDIEIVKLFLKFAPYSILIKNYEGLTPLDYFDGNWFWCRDGSLDMKILRTILETYPRVAPIPNRVGDTPVHTIVWRSRVPYDTPPFDVFEMFPDVVGMQNPYGTATPMHYMFYKPNWRSWFTVSEAFNMFLKYPYATFSQATCGDILIELFMKTFDDKEINPCLRTAAEIIISTGTRPLQNVSAPSVESVEYSIGFKLIDVLTSLRPDAINYVNDSGITPFLCLGSEEEIDTEFKNEEKWKLANMFLERTASHFKFVNEPERFTDVHLHLHLACRMNSPLNLNLEMTRKHPDWIITRDSYGRNPLHYACTAPKWTQNSRPVFKTIIKAFMDNNSKVVFMEDLSSGRNPLILAMATGRKYTEDGLKVMVDADPDIAESRVLDKAKNDEKQRGGQRAVK